MAGMVKTCGPLVLTVALVLAGRLGAQTAPTSADLASRIQAHYDTVRDFRASFVQSQTSAVLGEKTTSRGDVKVKKPNRMYWTYTVPEKRLFVADGARIFTFDPTPADPSCTVTPLPEGDQIPQGIMFLAGRGSLTRDFTSHVPAASPSGAWQLDLVPKVPQDDFSSLTLVVDRQTLALQAFMTTDREGNTSRFDFTQLKENVGLRDNEFTFTPPRGIKCESPAW
jgi:outer membrane lipoprotein carrier protein